MVSSVPSQTEPLKRRGNDPISWYLSNIGRVPLLTPAEEIELGNQVQKMMILTEDGQLTEKNKEFTRLFSDIKCENKVDLAINVAKEFNISILLKGANSIVADDKKVWQLFGTDSQTARAGLGDLLSGFIAGSSAIDLNFCRNITTDFFAKYVLLHSFAASKCKKGSNASVIGDELSKLMRNIKMRQIS